MRGAILIRLFGLGPRNFLPLCCFHSPVPLHREEGGIDNLRGEERAGVGHRRRER